VATDSDDAAADGAPPVAADGATPPVAADGAIPPPVVEPLSGQPVDTVDLSGETPFAVAFSRDGSTLAVGGGSGKIQFYDLAQRKVRQQVQLQRGWTWAVDFAPNGALAVSGGASKKLYVLDPQGKPVFTTQPHTSKTRVVVYSPDGSYLASASDDRTAIIHNAATGKRLHQLKHNGIVIGACFSPDGRTLATGGGKRAIRFWNVATGEPSGIIHAANPSCIWCVTYSPQGVLAAGCEQSFLTLWDAGRKPLHSIDLKSGRVSGVAFTQTGRLVAATTEKGGLFVFDVATGKQRQHIPPDGEKYTRVAFSPDDRLLAATVASGKVVIYAVK